MNAAVLLASHGTVEDLDDLQAFAANIRRGRPAPDDLVAELRRRYETIGGSPLNAITAEVARKLGERVGVPVGWANRLWTPYVRDVLGAFAAKGLRRVALVALAPHSAHVYEADARSAAEAYGIELRCAPNWGRSAGLCEAFASRIASAIDASPSPRNCLVVLTAHSLPSAVVRAGDPYERDVRAAAAAVAVAVSRRAKVAPRFAVAFQSQGRPEPDADGRGAEWLGPDLRSTLDRAVEQGERHVIAAPIGFVADHVEILYDLDVEAKAMAARRELTFSRTASLNAADDFVAVLEGVVRPLLAGA